MVVDPFWLTYEDDRRPLRQRLTPGAYTVATARATVGEGHRRNAAGLLVRAGGPVVRWEMGRFSDATAPDEWGTYAGYPVDAGAGCFASPEGAAVVAEVVAADEYKGEDPVSRILLTRESGGAGVCSPRPGGPAVAVFEAGWGDGSYPTWIGWDADGTIVVVVTDFLLTGDPYAEPPAE